MRKAHKIFVALFRIIIGYILCFYFSPLWASDTDVYKDKKGYFTFVPPQGWGVEESSTLFASRVQCRPQDGDAVIGIIALPDNDSLGNLFAIKKEFIEDHKRRFPQGKFVLSKTTFDGFEALRIDFEIPEIIKEEFYFFFAEGMRFDLMYGARDSADFEKYRPAALGSLASLKPLRRLLEK